MNKKLKNFLFLWLPPILFMGLIFYLSGIPKLEATSEPTGNLISRKLAHLTEYAILFILFFRAFGYQKSKLPLAFSLCVLYAISDEIHQLFVPLREGKATDVVVDSIGSVLGIFFVRVFKIKF
ncbi:MAG: VanZ family protein [Patescibacteria group bacterium]|nr:VanZ family protein [Patescibacteria group bacterium]